MKTFTALLRERSTHALALSLALTATGMLRVAPLFAGIEGAPYVAAALEQCANWLLLSLTIVATIAFFETAFAPWPARRRLLLQVISLALISALYAKYVGASAFLTVQYRRLGLGNEEALQAYILWLGWAMAALLTWYYRAEEISLRAGAELRRAEMDRQLASQRVLESRLKILEAQVEPGQLLDSLTRVQEQYERDPARGETSLEELIDDLRRRTLRST